MATRSVFRRLCEPVLALTVLMGSQAAPLFAQNPGAAPTFWTPETPPQPRPVQPRIVQPPMPVPQTMQAAPPPNPAEPLRLSRNVPGDATPIALAADEVVTWKESDQTIVVLLFGKVLAQHCTVQVRCDMAVARIDLRGHRERGLWRVDLYAEGGVRIDNTLDAKEAQRAVIDLTTHGGEVKVNSAKAKVLQRVLSDNPLYRRALAETARNAPPATTVQRVGMTNAPSLPPTPTLPMGPRPALAPPVMPPALSPPMAPVPTMPVMPKSPPLPVAPPPVAPRMPGPAAPPTPGVPSLPGEPLPDIRQPMSAAPSVSEVLGQARLDRAGQQDRFISFQFEPRAPDPPPPGANNVQPPFPPSGPPPSGPSAIPGPAGPVRPPPPRQPEPAAVVVSSGRVYTVRQRYGSPWRIEGTQRLNDGEQAIIIRAASS